MKDLFATDGMNQLLQALIGTNDLEVIVEKASIAIGNPLAVFSASYSLLSYSKVYPVTDPLWTSSMKRGHWSYELISRVKNVQEFAPGSDEYAFAIADDLTSLRRRTGRLYLQHNHLGYYVVLEAVASIDRIPEEVYRMVVGVLAKSVSVTHSMKRYGYLPDYEQILADMIERNHYDRAQLNMRIRGTAFEQVTTVKIVALDMSHYLTSNAIEANLKSVIQKMLPVSWSVYYSEHLIVLYDEEQCILRNRNSIAEFESMLKSSAIVAGISDPFCDLFHLSNYYYQAVSALQYRQSFKDSRTIVSYNDYKLYETIAHLPRDEARWRFCSSEVIQMSKYDAKQNTDYLSTLYHYIGTNKSLQDTACRLFVHRNTVSYRIRRIGELFGIDFEDEHMNILHFLSCMILSSANGKLPG
ncbi:MAG: PucR family transcriptional regulator [Christensenellales bacterium]|jgi:hypothetical protein